jgi:hypothetical protein
MNTNRALLVALTSFQLMLPFAAAANPSVTSGEVVDYFDLNIRDYKAKALPFSKVLASGAAGGNDKVLFDQTYRGRLCFISCHFYDGYTSRWSGYYLDLQPYESTCFALAGGCNTITFPRPDSRMKISVGSQEYELLMVDESRYRYYLPLATRQAISSSETAAVTIKTTWDKYREYRVGDKSRRLLGAVLNRNDEIATPDSGVPAALSIEERLNELKRLRGKGLIDESEYNRLRQKALGL